jgi:hypothetical protein
MPTISAFFGITIRTFFSDHPPPHFHVAYQRHRAVIAIQSGAIVGGALPPRYTASCASGQDGIARSW